MQKCHFSGHQNPERLMWTIENGRNLQILFPLKDSILAFLFTLNYDLLSMQRLPLTLALPTRYNPNKTHP